MMLIPCPWCGEREETEFHYGGQAHVAYPDDPSAVDDAGWAAYLFVRDNSKGWFAERWLHRAGCQRWFNAVRHTVTYEIAAAYPPGATRPVIG
ncbi:MAG: sarcosine oxidase subunit delta [Geodermatophilaceae bacterium]|nr:sarcosine oxidase subunit delta [Geodermatophilaceae bacterium]